MTTHEQLTSHILGRVYLIYLLRRFSQPAFLALYGGIGAVVTVLPFVSVPAVLHNLSGVSGWRGVLQFHGDAFFHTELVVQVAILVLAVVFAVWMREGVRSILRAHTVVLRLAQ